MSFDRLGLRAELLDAIKTKGYKTATPIQSQAIPVILSGRDILARAQTGTGKTDAFALPLVEILSRQTSRGPHPRALVLTPTRELALQVGECIKAYARRVSMRCTVVFGGVRIEPQINRLKRGVDILVATPGRLLDLVIQGCVGLSDIEFLVFDEADRMLDLGFSQDMKRILDRVPVQRRTMLFSATFSQDIRTLAKQMLNQPERIEVTPEITTAETVQQIVHRVESLNKKALLVHLISRGGWARVLIFVRTKHGADKLRDQLIASGISSEALHGNMSQSVRIRTLDGFKNGEIRILVATDVAARGLDIQQIPYVINYDIPRIPEDYIHRIGRTGRAGVSGVAISLVSPREKASLEAIEGLIRQKIRVETVTGFTEGSDVPDFVLYRPGSATSEKHADPEIMDIVSRRAASRKQSTTRKDKSAAAPKAVRPRQRRDNAEKKPARPKDPAARPSKKGAPGKRCL